MRVRCVLFVLGLVLLAGCGGDDEETPATATTGGAPQAEFALVPDAPGDYEDVAGTAQLVRSDSGTDVSISLTGLMPDTEYISHVHAGGCDQPDPGGPHFKFDLDGSDMPPNEIHLPFTSDADGAGEATATNDQTVPEGEGRSIVVHETSADHGGDHHGAAGAGAHMHPPKIACAPLADGAADGSGTAADATEITVSDGEPEGGIAEIEVAKGDRVQLTVSADAEEEVHVHAYDLYEEVGPDQPAEFDFTADIEGIFEVELENAGVQVAQLRVNP